jgi:integrase
MFTTGNGTPFSPRNFFRDFKEQIEKAGLPQIRFHDLRHTAVSYLTSLGVPPAVVQGIVGHSSALLTLDVYTHTTPQMQDEAMEKMGELFGNIG